MAPGELDLGYALDRCEQQIVSLERQLSGFELELSGREELLEPTDGFDEVLQLGRVTLELLHVKRKTLMTLAEVRERCRLLAQASPSE